MEAGSIDPSDVKTTPVSLASMVKDQLGQKGAAVVSGPYLFLHYSLLVACESH
jgi:hypothetical protein